MFVNGVLIPLAGVALLAGFIWWVLRRYGEGGYREDGQSIWARLRDWWEAKKADAAARELATEPPLRPREIYDHDPPSAYSPYRNPPPPPPPTNGNTAPPETQMAPAAAQSDLLHAISSLVSQASSGDIKAVRRVVKTLATAADGLGLAISRVGTRLAEPDKHYGNEIWEPLVAGGAQCRASSMHCAQADTGLLSLLSATVSELADSPRQAPHHSQLNGGN